MNSDDLKLSSYNYNLPKTLIAQYPTQHRDQSRMLLVERHSGKVTNKKFSEIVSLLPKSSCIVVNNTKVIPARLIGKRMTGAKIEALLIEEIKNGVWRALVSKSRRIKNGETIDFFDGKLLAIAQRKLKNGEWVLIFDNKKKIKDQLEKFGLPPLPPYIERDGITKLNNDCPTAYKYKSLTLAIIVGWVTLYWISVMVLPLLSRWVEKILLSGVIRETSAICRKGFSESISTSAGLVAPEFKLFISSSDFTEAGFSIPMVSY